MLVKFTLTILLGFLILRKKSKLMPLHTISLEIVFHNQKICLQSVLTLPTSKGNTQLEQFTSTD